MRRFLPFIIIGVLGVVYLWQKQKESAPVAAKPAIAQTTERKEPPLVAAKTAAPQTSDPQKVSEHNWMKRSLDRARDVTQKVSAQRTENEEK